MTSSLCGNDENIWEEALQATIESLKMRINLWDGAYSQIMLRKNTAKKM
jgi:Protein of unknown function (DUF3050)